MNEKSFPTEQIITINEKTYQYYEVGQGEKCILFLHGLASGNEEELNSYLCLSDKFRCIFPDLPGHQMLPLYGCTTLEKISLYLIDLIDHLMLQNLTIVGFSFGGVVAQETAKILNKRGINVDVIAVATPLEKSFLTPIAYTCIEYVSKTPKRLYDFLTSSSKIKETFRKLGINLTEIDFKNLNMFDYSQIKLIASCIPDHQEDSSELRTLYIYGTQDPLIKDDSYTKTILFNDRQRKMLIDRGGHFGTKEGHEKVVQEIEKFITMTEQTIKLTE